MSELQTGQQEIFDYVKNNLGEGMIDVELDHYIMDLKMNWFMLVQKLVV